MGGVVASSDPRAARAGIDVLAAGGNAVDAAVAAVLVLFVVEPHYCGPGGDAFIVVAEPGRTPEALDGSGAVPRGLTPEALAADGLDNVPVRGPRTVTVPGAVGLLEEALTRYGTRTIKDLVGPAVGFAREGFEARRTLAETSARAAESIAGDPVLGPLYTPGGAPLSIGQRVVNARLAGLLEQIAREGAEPIYRGAVAEAIVATVRGTGGYLEIDDMRAHRTMPIELLSTAFRGRLVWELPRPTQGPAVLAALDRLEPLGEIRWEDVLDAIGAGLASIGIDMSQRPGAPAKAGPRDTTYVAAIDGEGRGASLITSVFADFGSHLGVEALGGAIHNRATTFFAQRQPPRPGKPPHTTIPAAVTRDGALEYVLGLAGGYVQAQVQVQLLVRMIVEGLSPQEAIDAPRMKLEFGGAMTLEPGHPLGERFPDAVGRPTGPEGFGGAQAAARLNGTLAGGADPRRDGAAVVI